MLFFDISCDRCTSYLVHWLFGYLNKVLYLFLYLFLGCIFHFNLKLLVIGIFLLPYLVNILLNPYFVVLSSRFSLILLYLKLVWFFLFYRPFSLSSWFLFGFSLAFLLLPQIIMLIFCLYFNFLRNSLPLLVIMFWSRIYLNLFRINLFNFALLWLIFECLFFEILLNFFFV